MQALILIKANKGDGWGQSLCLFEYENLRVPEIPCESSEKQCCHPSEEAGEESDWKGREK